MPVDAENRSWPRLSPLVYFSNNWISLIGVVVVTTATIFWLFLLPTTVQGQASAPYIGILAFLVVPAAFFAGLALIPLGIAIQRKKEGRRGIYPSSFPPLTWQNREFRRLVYFVGLTTFANLVVASQATYGAVNYMDSVTFCGQTCHNVMQPEYTAFQVSPHARLECVQCHIGPGASWFVRSKLTGVGQVFAVAFHTYPTPIPTPVQNLRPARETCETCHWPEVFGQDRVEVLWKFADDEKNTLTKTVLLMKIGGGNQGIGIHGTHLGRGVRILYTPTDPSRQTISRVEYTAGGKTTVYAASDPPAKGSPQPPRVMDCMDCHNRPSHNFQLPERAVDNAMQAGDISPSLPFAKKESVALLKANYATRQEAAQRIPEEFEQFYRAQYPAVYTQQDGAVRNSARQVLAIYDRNIFPAMKVTWGTYPNDLGHMDFPGCFRCHDGGHSTKDGSKAITNDCNACHNLLAVDEANPKILGDLGIVEKVPAAVSRQ
ncbi:MAG TPA: hypothetical protein VJ732_08620 [Bryobacteraceae bacterium]|nr:hypothetical protein [Bryobacteraceae bacterium]